MLLFSPTPTPGVVPPVYPALNFTVIDELGNAYYQPTDFTLDTTLGTITWNQPSPCPVNRVYYVDYTFSYDGLVKRIVNQMKFPQERIIYQWL